MIVPPHFDQYILVSFRKVAVCWKQLKESVWTFGRKPIEDIIKTQA